MDGDVGEEGERGEGGAEGEEEGTGAGVTEVAAEAEPNAAQCNSKKPPRRHDFSLFCCDKAIALAR